MSEDKNSTTDNLLDSKDGSKNELLQYVEWTPEHEKILIEWADKALCYKWLHEKSHISYSKKNTWFTIPVIIMSTLTGTANFAQNRVPVDYINLFTIGVGAVNILAGILTTIQQFLKISELNESHRVSSIAWGKFYRNIKIELAKSPKERTPVIQLLKISKDEYDRLIETSQSISTKIIQSFKDTFSGGEIKYDSEGHKLPMNVKQTIFSEIKKPEVCDEIESTINSLYRPTIIETKLDIAPPVVNNKFTDLIKKVNENKKFKDKINAFIEQFKLEKIRDPNIDEIIDNLDHEISPEIIKNIINNRNIVNLDITTDDQEI